MAQKRLQKVIRDAKELRSTFLEQRAEKLAQEGEGTKEQVIKKIKREEESAKSFQLLRRAMGKESQGGIKFILVPGEETKEDSNKDYETLIPIFQPEEIERKILQRNKRHFSQAQGTPFTVSPLSDIFGYDGVTEEANSLLNGKLDISTIETSEAAQSILEALSQPREGIQDIQTAITPDDLRQGFKKWR